MSHNQQIRRSHCVNFSNDMIVLKRIRTFSDCYLNYLSCCNAPTPRPKTFDRTPRSNVGNEVVRNLNYSTSLARAQHWPIKFWIMISFSDDHSEDNLYYLLCVLQIYIDVLWWMLAWRYKVLDVMYSLIFIVYHI